MEETAFILSDTQEGFQHGQHEGWNLEKGCQCAGVIEGRGYGDGEGEGI